MDAALVQKIISHARPGGAISADELATIAPLDSMSTEETAQLIAELEHAGVTVDVDSRLTQPTRSPGSGSVDTGALRLPEAENHRASDRDPPIPLTSNLQKPGNPQGSTWRTAITISTVLCIVALVLLIWFFER